MYDPSHFRLDHKVAVITGAGAGIGRAIAETFAAVGCAVMVSDRDMESAGAVAAAITSKGGKAGAMACDVTREDELAALVHQTVAQFGALHVLVSNAGGGGPKPFDMPMSDFRRAFDLNVHSLFDPQHCFRPGADGHPRQRHRPWGYTHRSPGIGAHRRNRWQDARTHAHPPTG